MNIGFIIDEWDGLNPAKDSTLRMIHECCARGHNVGILYPYNLTIRDNITYGFVKVLKKESYALNSFASFHKKMKFNEKMMPINAFDALFLRKDPPVDSIMLNFLDSVKDEVFIVNDIDGIRKANNKLYTTTFHDPEDEFLPKTYVSKNTEYLKGIIEKSTEERMILKPLDGYGGSGVIVIEKSASKNLSSLLDFYINGKTGKHYVIVQEYIPEAENGDVRVMMLNGEPIGAYRRVPSETDNRSNIHAGGTAQKYILTDHDLKMCRRIGKKLVQDGLYLVGLDIIAGKLIEVNVQSPGGIVNINKMSKNKIEKNIIDFVEEKVQEIEDFFNMKEFRLNRRRIFKKEVFSGKIED